MNNDVTVVEINNTVTIVEDNYTVHILEGMGPVGSFDDGPVDYVDFNLAAVSAYLAGRLRWNDTYHAPEFDTADGGTFVIGQSIPVWAVNKTGAPLAEGTPVYISDAQGQSPTILVAEQTDGAATARTIGLVKVEIAPNARGPVATFGPITGLDTSALIEGQRCWVGIGGDITSTEPVWPAHNMRVGYCIYSHANQGIVLVSTQKGFHLEHLYEVKFSGEAADDIMMRQANGQWENVPSREKFLPRSPWFGTFAEPFNALATSDGAIITMSLQSKAGGDLTMQFSDAISTLDCTPADTIELTAGTDAVPKKNFIYILQSSKVLTKSLVGWPTGEHIKVAFFFCETAAYVQADGALINQNHNDELFDTNGHIAHMSACQRRGGVGWFDGHDGEGTSGYLTLGAGTATIQIGAGVLSQLHLHNTAAIDTSAGDDFHVVNGASGYSQHSDLTEITVDANGDSLNNKYFTVILAAAGNKGGEYSPALLLLPSGSYNTFADAIEDGKKHNNYNLPREFVLDSSVGFLIAALTVRLAGGNITLHNTVDLRGLDGRTASGGTAGATVTTGYLEHEDFVDDGVLGDSWLPVATSGLDATEPAGSGVIESHKVETVAGSDHTYTALKDTYVDMTAAGEFVYTEEANGAAAPAISGTNQRLAKVVTDGTDVTSIVDMRTMVLIKSTVLPAAGGGSRFEEVSRVSVPSGVTTIDFMDIFTDDYDIYHIEFNGVEGTTTGRLLLQLGYGVGPTWKVSGYSYHFSQQSRFSNLYTAVNSSADTAALIGTGTTTGRFWDIDVILNHLREVAFSPTIKGTGGSYANNGTVAVFSECRSSFLDITNKYDHLRILLDTGGNTFSGGTIIVWGAKL